MLFFHMQTSILFIDFHQKNKKKQYFIRFLLSSVCDAENVFVCHTKITYVNSLHAK